MLGDGARLADSPSQLHGGFDVNCSFERLIEVLGMGGNTSAATL